MTQPPAPANDNRPARRVRFKQADITRAVRAFQQTGITIGRVEISATGAISIIPAGGAQRTTLTPPLWRVGERLMRVELKGIHTTFKKLANGMTRIYYYAWRGGPRLPGKPGSPEFIAAHRKACTEREPTIGNGTLRSLTESYQKSTDFRAKAPHTRADYVKQIAKIEGKFGTLPLSALPATATRGCLRVGAMSWLSNLSARLIMHGPCLRSFWPGRRTEGKF